MTEPPIAVPVCYRHPSRETYVRCTRCDRPICPDCMFEASVGHQCPDCVAAGRRASRPHRTVFGGGTSGARGRITMTLVVVNCLVAVASFISASASSTYSGSPLASLMGSMTPLHYWGALIAEPARMRLTDGTIILLSGVSGGDYYRLISSMFLHYGVIHLALNMWALWVLGRSLEPVFGPARFLTLYLLSGFGGSVAVYVFGGPTSLTVGASGAIFGLFAALFVVLRRLGRDSSSLLPLLLVNLVITFTVPGISIAGHLGGLVCGGIVAAGLAYPKGQSRTIIQTAACGALGIALILATVIHTAMITGSY